MRRFPFVAAILAVGLLATGVFGLRAAAAGVAAQQSELRADAVQISGDFQAYFERAASLDLLLAQNPAFTAAFRHYYGDRKALAREGPMVNDMRSALAYLQVLYPGSIGEACFIDDHGRELARVVNGRPAPYSNLSLTESANPFFHPTLNLPAGVVYQAAPYVSPDTYQWVISNSTAIQPERGQYALVHFEVSLESFRPYLETSLGNGYHAAVVDGNTGQIILSSDRSVAGATASGPGVGATAWSRNLTASKREVGTIRVGKANGAFRRVNVATGNANDWVIVEWSAAVPTILPTWAAEGFIGLGLLLLLFALWTLRRQHRALRAAARLDGLTGLGNRQAIHEALRAAIRDTDLVKGERIGVLMLDLNGFKQVNDVYGHHHGDLLLQEIARRLHANVFEYDTPGRLGGDEFAVVLRHLDSDADALSVANRLAQALTRPIELQGTAHFIGVSAGAAIYPDHGTTPDELIRSADAAMYSAKRDRDAPRLYRPGTASGADDLENAAELLSAIEHGEIVLHFQAEVSMRTGGLVTAEALARWQHPTRGMIPPAAFIPLAERVGLIRPLTNEVLKQALDQVKRWQAAGTYIGVSVNLSGRLLSDEQIATEIHNALDQRGLAASVLTVEITETALLTDPETAARVLRRLRDMGVRIEIDDFGAGYASFGYLRDLPLDGVKLDREFINAQLVDEDSTGLLRATIGTCHTLGLTVVAEGVEDQAVHNRLRDLGCDTAQGFLIARPVPAEQLRVPVASDLSH